MSVAPTIVSVSDNAQPFVGEDRSYGGFINDTAPTVTVSLTGTGAQPGDLLHLAEPYGTTTALGPTVTLTAEAVASGQASIQLSGLADGYYPVEAIILHPDGTAVGTSQVLPFGVATTNAATPTIVGFFDDSTGGWAPVAAGGSTADPTPIVRVQVPGVPTSFVSPGHPPFGDGVAIHQGSVVLYADGAPVGTGWINPFGYVDFNTSVLTAGTHSLSAITLDRAGNASAVSGAVSLTVTPSSATTSQDGTAAGEAITGTAAPEFIRAFDGDDTVHGGAGDDDLNGNVGQDIVHGDEGADWVRGGQGSDTVFGDAGNDPHVNGNKGDDVVHGGDGNDTVYGGQGADQVFGDAGADRLYGDLGDDTLTGGAGADRFVFGHGMGHDVVTDFNAAEGDAVHLLIETPYTASVVDGNTVLDLGGGDTITLMGTATYSVVFGATL